MVCCRALAGCVLTGRRNVPIKSEEIPSFFYVSSRVSFYHFHLLFLRELRRIPQNGDYISRTF